VTILLLEDLEDWGVRIGDLLRARGHHVDWARTLYEARLLTSNYTLDTAYYGPPPWDAVFADHDMPTNDPDGADDGSSAGVVKLLLAAKPSVFVVAISAIPSNNDHLLSVGARLAVQKGELPQFIDVVLGRITCHAA
jgi:DNA-binding response OmpR family regulator